MDEKRVNKKHTRETAGKGARRPAPRRKQQPSLFRIFTPVIVFGAAMLWVAADKGAHPWAVAAMALGLGVLLSSLAPRHKLLLGSLPALGIFLIILILEFNGVGWQAVAEFWAPVGLGAIVGALLGTRVKIM